MAPLHSFGSFSDGLFSLHVTTSWFCIKILSNRLTSTREHQQCLSAKQVHRSVCEPAINNRDDNEDCNTFVASRTKHRDTGHEDNAILSTLTGSSNSRSPDGDRHNRL